MSLRANMNRKRMRVNVPSLLVADPSHLTEKGKQIKITIEAEERKTNALMQTVKVYRENLKLMERELYAKQKRKEMQILDLDEL